MTMILSLKSAWPLLNKKNREQRWKQPWRYRTFTAYVLGPRTHWPHDPNLDARGFGQTHACSLCQGEGKSFQDSIDNCSGHAARFGKPTNLSALKQTGK